MSQKNNVSFFLSKKKKTDWSDDDCTVLPRWWSNTWYQVLSDGRNFQHMPIHWPVVVNKIWSYISQQFRKDIRWQRTEKTGSSPQQLQLQFLMFWIMFTLKVRPNLIGRSLLACPIKMQCTFYTWLSSLTWRDDNCIVRSVDGPWHFFILAWDRLCVCFGWVGWVGELQCPRLFFT